MKVNKDSLKITRFSHFLVLYFTHKVEWNNEDRQTVTDTSMQRRNCARKEAFAEADIFIHFELLHLY